MISSRRCSAFLGHRRVAQGSILEVALQVRERLQKKSDSAILVFDDVTGHPVDLDLRGSVREITRRYRAVEAPGTEPERKGGPGRPKLGVVAREVTLLPRHWEWLGSQPGGASVTLRKLVEEARSKNQRQDRVRQAQEAAHRFMSAMAGDLPGYEEALRAFYAGKLEAFSKRIGDWPKDIRDQVLGLSAPVFEERKGERDGR